MHYKCVRVCRRDVVWGTTQKGCRYKSMEIYAEAECGALEEEGEWGSGGGGVNFDMSFLKLSFDNWQFVQLVKCQESKKIDEVHNRCLRLTRRCGLESHACIRPPKRYGNEICCTHTRMHANTHKQIHTRTRLLKSTSDMKNWPTSIYLG